MSFLTRSGAIAASLLLAGGAGAAGASLVGDHGSTPAATTTTVTAPAATARAVSEPATTSAEAVYGATKDAVAYVSATTPQGQATGSGFLVSSDGRIITNEHVVDGATDVKVKLGTSGQARTAKVLAADASKDLAILQVDLTGLSVKPLALASNASVEVGEATYAIGNPYGLDHTFTSGIVSALGREIDAPDGTPIQDAIQTDAAINPGNSGGALLDGDGRVIGVNSQIASSGSSSGNVGIGFAIPVDTVKAFIANPTSSQATSVQDQAGADGSVPQLGLPQS